MIQRKTSNLKALGHQEISASASPEFSKPLEWFIAHVEEAAQSGSAYQDNQTIKIGWMVIKLIKQDHLLHCFEPSFNQMPIKWKEGLDTTFRDLLIQKEVCKIMAVDSEFPSILDVGIYSNSLSDFDHNFIMARDEERNTDCGWGFQEPERSNSARKMSLFEIALKQKIIVPFLSLPSPCEVRFTLKNVIITCNSSTMSSLKSDFLHRLTVSSPYGFS